MGVHKFSFLCHRSQYSERFLDYRKFLQSKNPVAYALMAKMNYDRRQALRLKQDFFRLVIGSAIDPARISLLLEFIDTYMRLDRKEEKEFNEIIFREPEFREAKKMATTWELAGLRKGRKEGRKEGLLSGLRKGLQKGRFEGEIRGKQTTLLLQMEKKFGKLAPEVRRKIRGIDSAKKLESLALAVLDAQSLNQLDL